MTRPAEAALAKWDEIDYNNKLWIVPANRMKTVIEHKIPLIKQTLSLLHDCKLISAFSPYIFPADRDPASHANKASVNIALKRMGYQGFTYEPSEACLSHKVGNSVSQSYSHSTYLNQRVEIMRWWSDHITSTSLLGDTYRENDVSAIILGHNNI